MGLTFHRVKRPKGIWFTVSKVGYHRAFTAGLCFDFAHTNATEQRFKAWASMGWPYKVKD